MGILKKIDWLFIILIGWSVLFTNALPEAMAAEAVRLQENKIKAGLLYNFIKYTSWPKGAFHDPAEAFQVCLYGGDAFEGALDPLQGRTAQQRSINIRRISRLNNLAWCHAVFIHRSEAQNLSSVLQKMKGVPALLISDIAGFCQKGGMVEFSNPTQKRIELCLNRNVIADAGLGVGDPLIKLAQER